jgi:hypothetical protein
LIKNTKEVFSQKKALNIFKEYFGLYAFIDFLKSSEIGGRMDSLRIASIKRIEEGTLY